MKTVKRALLSVSDKTGLLELAGFLQQHNVEILSTGGTARLLTENDIQVTEVSDYTGFPEMMDGRVKTLHPKIHGAILGRRDTDMEVMRAHGIEPIDLVVVNLYPFQQTVADDRCSLAQAIENIDIGGPTLLRAAAKNYRDVAVIVDAADYQPIIDALEQNDLALDEETRFRLAVKAFAHTAQYDGAISNYLSTLSGAAQEEKSAFPQTLNLQFHKLQDLRYGENPHQRAAFYRNTDGGGGIADARQLQGKALSYNNIADSDAALECVRQFDTPACVIVKHANPCGVAVGDRLLEAYDKAYRTDPTSAFGGIIAFNRELDEATAASIIERQFVEVIIAPGFSAQACKALSDKKNIRVLQTGEQHSAGRDRLDFKPVGGGLLLQDLDTGMIDQADLKLVTRRKPDAQETIDLLFAWKVAKFVKSNAIVYCKDLATVGVGAGQMSRVYSARIAAIKARDAGLEVKGSVMASDAFFPFRDGLDSAAEAGVTAVIQPGGSMRDDEVIAAADEHDIAMVFTGMRHFRH